MVNQHDLGASRYVTNSGVVPGLSTVLIDGKHYACGVGQSDKGMVCQLLTSYSSANTRQGWTEVNLSNR